MRALLLLMALGLAAPAEAGTGWAPVWQRGQIAGGEGHTCRLLGGRIACWGNNIYGQLGDGTTTAHVTPLWVPGISDAVSVWAGFDHTCVVRAGGAVTCWGDPGHRGALAIDGLNDAVELAPAAWHTCARTQSGSVACWEVGADRAQALPVKRVTAIASGFQHTCLLDGGALRCLGYRSQPGTLTPLVEVARIDGVALAAADDVTCVLRTDRAISCWTFKDDLTATRTDLPIADPVDVVAGGFGATFVVARAGGQVVTLGRDLAVAEQRPELGRLTALAKGGLQACGVAADGHSVCWGIDDGELGRPSRRNSNPTPTPVPGLDDAVQVVAATTMACALRRGGAVVCWGQGLLGDGVTTDSATPVAVKGLGDAVQLHGGQRFVCATRKGGQVVCWGQAEWRECFWDSPDNCQPQDVPTPTPVKGLLDWPGATAMAFPCAIVAGGKVDCLHFDSTRLGPPDHIAGLSGVTQLGKGLALVAGKVFDFQHTQIAGLGQVRFLATGEDHACVLDGGVRCWGANASGQLGDGSHTARATPTLVPGLSRVVQLAAGQGVTCAREAKGKLWCWGSNAHGAVGDGQARDARRPVVVLKDAEEVVASEDLVCARRRGGKVACWGRAAEQRGVPQVSVAQPVVVGDPED